MGGKRGGANSNNAYYSNMNNKASNPVQVDDDMPDMKPDVHQSLGSKKI